MPFRWMAPESLQYMQFSTKSDVCVFFNVLFLFNFLGFSWSFGVLLYELFSLGEMPYGSLQQAEIVDFLNDGHRLSCPQWAQESM
jgi:hypothetical protein